MPDDVQVLAHEREDQRRGSEFSSHHAGKFSSVSFFSLFSYPGVGLLEDGEGRPLCHEEPARQSQRALDDGGDPSAPNRQLPARFDGQPDLLRRGLAPRGLATQVVAQGADLEAAFLLVDKEALGHQGRSDAVRQRPHLAEALRPGGDDEAVVVDVLRVEPGIPC